MATNDNNSGVTTPLSGNMAFHSSTVEHVGTLGTIPHECVVHVMNFLGIDDFFAVVDILNDVCKQSNVPKPSLVVNATNLVKDVHRHKFCCQQVEGCVYSDEDDDEFGFFYEVGHVTYRGQSAIWWPVWTTYRNPNKRLHSEWCSWLAKHFRWIPFEEPRSKFELPFWQVWKEETLGRWHKETEEYLASGCNKEPTWFYDYLYRFRYVESMMVWMSDELKWNSRPPRTENERTMMKDFSYY